MGAPLSAAEALSRKEGACVESAHLLAALARARGIPAQIALGLLYDQETSQYLGHAWVEVSVETETWQGWYPCDAGTSQEVDAKYIKLFHTTDIQLPSDMSRTPRGVLISNVIESIEVIDVVYDSTPIND